MKNKILLVISGALIILWGISHLIPTNNIVAGFGNISLDNQRIIRMEWINEGLTLLFIGVLIITITLIKSQEGKSKKIIYLLTFVMLIAMAILSLFTGFKIDYLPFKLCPYIFSISAIPLLISVLKNKK